MLPQAFKVRINPNIIISHLIFYYKSNGQIEFNTLISTQMYERTAKIIEDEKDESIKFY